MSRHHDDFAIEPIPGLPAHLPKGETIVWQGSPDWRGVATSVFHTRKIAVYFALIAAWKVAIFLHDGGTVMDLAGDLSFLVALAGLAIGILAIWAWGVGRTTIYTITTKRVVFRHGVAVPVTVNVPFAVLDAAAMTRRGGFGDIALTVGKDHKVSYLLMWPHARPWRFAHPEPMLRSLAEPDRVAALLAEAFAAAQPARVTLGAVAAEGEPRVEPADGRLSPVAG